jgi:uncharacterized protein
MEKETRAKYSQDEIDALGKKGQAYRNSDGTYSYPVADEEDLKNAIRAVGRAGADHDAVRRFIIKRAKALDLSELIPDSWSSDGSLSEGASAWTPEQRDTANDVFSALEGAVSDACPNYYTWVQDWYGSGTDDDPWMVVYCCACDLYAAPFSWDDQNRVVVDVENAIKVRRVTAYIARSKRSPLGEWRQRKAEGLKGLIERRDIPTDAMELREVETASGEQVLRLTGYASRTEVPYEVGFYTEVIKRGAFKRTLGEDPDVQLLVNHEGLPLARTRSGTLQLSEDDMGLRVQADLDPEDPDVQRLARKMRRGDIDQMSFAFRATDQVWNEDFTRRDITAASIHRGDVSVVNMGANEAATAAIRSREALEALQRVGPEGLVAALTEWRDLTLLPFEERAGKTLSAASMEVLSRVLELVASADVAVDEAQPLLAELMGVPNPDTDDESAEEDPADAGDGQRAAPALDLRARRFRDERRLHDLRNRRKAAV